MTAPRSAFTALALSLLSSGLGHIYCGKIVKGLVLFFAWFAIPPLLIGAALAKPSTAVLVGMIIAPFVGLIGLYFYAAIDAVAIARRSGQDYKLKEYNRTVVYVLMAAVGVSYPIGIVLGIRAFVFEAFYIPTNSMAPNVVGGDRVLANKLAIRLRFPRRGDLVVFRQFHPQRRQLIKRVIGLPGDTIEVRAGKVVLNGKSLVLDRVPTESLDRLPHLADPSASSVSAFEESSAGARYRILLADGEKSPAQRDHPATKIPPRHVFVLGDNRDFSVDSRQFGVVPIGDILGYVEYLYKPAGSWKRFGGFDGLR